MRVGEIAALAIGDVATVNGDVRREAKLGAHQTKGSKGRTVILSEHVRKEIRSFHLVSELGAGGEQRRQGAGRDEVIGAPQIGDDGLAHGAVKTLVLDYLDVGAMGRFFDAEKHGDLQKQATTKSNSFFQIKAQIYANVAPRFEKAAALHQSNQVLALTTAILLFKLGLNTRRPPAMC